MHFEIVGKITEIEIIAVGPGIRILEVSCESDLAGVDGEAAKELPPCACLMVGYGLPQVHWFEAHGIGKRKMRIKRYLD